MQSRVPRRFRAVLLVICLLSPGLVGMPGAVLAVGSTPPSIMFAGELAGAPAYDHLVLSYSPRLDPSVPIGLDQFTITLNGTGYAPAAASYLYSGLAGLGNPFDEGGVTFLRLDLPAGVTIDAGTVGHVAYLPGASPLRDRSLVEAPAQTVGIEVLDFFGGFEFAGAVVDGENGADRLTLLFGGQLDLSSLPATGDFTVTVNGNPRPVLAVEARVPDLGLGLLDLVLAAPVANDDGVDLAYVEGTQPLRERYGGVATGDFAQAGVTVIVQPTSASGTVAAGGSISTATGDPPTAADPIATTVLSPNAGDVSIDEVPADPSPAGYTFFGQQVVISAPPASSAVNPLVLTFQIDATLVPAGQDASTIVVLRNGTPIADCMGPPGTADPLTCIASRTDLSNGDIEITVYTIAASRWNFAVVMPFEFGGFQAPLVGGDVRNLVKAGAAIPVRFSLGGDRGMAIFTAGSPASRAVECDTASPLDPVEETVSPGSSSLTYNAATDTYTYIWSTSRSWSGSCRRLTLTFGDGSQQAVVFQFR